MRYQDIKKLIHFLDIPKSCFIIGAGVSARLVPVTSQFNKQINSDDINTFDPTENKIGVIHDVFSGNEEINALRNHITISTLKMLSLSRIVACSNERKLEYAEIIPPEYGLFWYLPFSSTIIDFNLDGFSKKWCPQRCIYPHGQNEAYSFLLNEETKDDLIEYCQNYEIGNRRILPDIILFEKEENKDAFKFAYQYMKEILFTCNAVIIIGYSFAFTNGKFNDICTLNLFTKIMAHRKIPIVIINPSAAFFATIIKELCKSNNVLAYDLLWDKFSEAYLSVTYHDRCCIRQMSAKSIMKFYN